MHPTLFRIGSFEVKSFSLMLMIGILLGTILAYRRARKFGIDPNRIADVSVWAVIAGVFGARIVFILQEWPYYRSHPQELFSLRFEGLTSFGGFIFGFLAVVIWCRTQRLSLISIMDTLGVPLLVANAIGRVGCFLNGCCFGIACPPPLGVHFHGASGTHQPAQLYETAFGLLSAGAIMVLENKAPRGPGFSAGISIFLLGAGRFIYEFFRAGTVEEVARGVASSTRIPGLWITEAQVVAFLIALVGSWLIIRANRRAQPNVSVAPPQEIANP